MFWKPLHPEKRPVGIKDIELESDVSSVNPLQFSNTYSPR